MPALSPASEPVPSAAVPVVALTPAAPAPASSSSRRCTECDRRMNLSARVAGRCVCGSVVCGRCREAHDARCAFDHRAAQRARLAAVPRVAPPKVDRI